MTNTEERSDSVLDTILDSISDEEFAIADKKMSMAAKIANAMEDKGWKHKDLIYALGKGSPSEVTKWLSGTHNFTVETLVKLGRALEINLLAIEGEAKTVVKFSGRVSMQETYQVFEHIPYQTHEENHRFKKMACISTHNVVAKV